MINRALYLALAAKATTVDVSYEDLVELHEKGELKPGAFYRITDYVTSINGRYTFESGTYVGHYLTYARSAGHPFDIIVLATDKDTFSEDALAIQHEGDAYFANSNLAAWELKYTTENDTDRFPWADPDGKGVIYHMKDEFGNECRYDFKNVQFLRYGLTDDGSINISFDYNTDAQWIYGSSNAIIYALSLQQDNPYQAVHYDYALRTESGYELANLLDRAEIDSTYFEEYVAMWCYTFHVYGSERDASLGGHYMNVKILSYYTNEHHNPQRCPLPDIVFFNDEETPSEGVYDILIDGTSCGNTLYGSSTYDVSLYSCQNCCFASDIESSAFSECRRVFIGAMNYNLNFTSVNDSITQSEVYGCMSKEGAGLEIGDGCSYTLLECYDSEIGSQCMRITLRTCSEVVLGPECIDVDICGSSSITLGNTVETVRIASGGDSISIAANSASIQVGRNVTELTLTGECYSIIVGDYVSNVTLDDSDTVTIGNNASNVTLHNARYVYIGGSCDDIELRRSPLRVTFGAGCGNISDELIGGLMNCEFGANCYNISLECDDPDPGRLYNLYVESDVHDISIEWQSDESVGGYRILSQVQGTTNNPLLIDVATSLPNVTYVGLDEYTHLRTWSPADASPIVMQNVAVASSAFIADATYADYPYRAAIANSAVNQQMIPMVVFAPADADSGRNL